MNKMSKKELEREIEINEIETKQLIESIHKSIDNLSAITDSLGKLRF